MDVKRGTDPITLLQARGDWSFEYVYRLFGDDWEHDPLLLEAILQPDPNIPYPTLHRRANATGPQRTSGGFGGGYENYLVGGW